MAPARAPPSRRPPCYWWPPPFCSAGARRKPTPLFEAEPLGDLGVEAHARLLHDEGVARAGNDDELLVGVRQSGEEHRQVRLVDGRQTVEVPDDDHGRCWDLL